MVFRSLEAFARNQPRDGSALVIGNLDGVHGGHAALIQSSLARRPHPTGVLTFSPHPQEVLQPGLSGHRLTTDEEKFALLKAAGVEWILALPFNQALANQTPSEFFETVLRDSIRASSVHVGFDFRFGKRREGDAVMLQALAAPASMEICLVAAVERDGVRISSSGIREQVRQGNIERAAQWMGRPYRMSGTVVGGAGRGKGLGFPTANVQYPAEKVAPRSGVYFTRVYWQDRAFRAIANFGFRPTFGSGDVPHLEVHLLDAMQDLYGQTVQVDFIRWIREERRFASVQELKAQVLADIAAAKKAEG
jgi:riboflavin kinase / FMN adenylyltransferase